MWFSYPVHSSAVQNEQTETEEFEGQNGGYHGGVPYCDGFQYRSTYDELVAVIRVLLSVSCRKKISFGVQTFHPVHGLFCAGPGVAAQVVVVARTRASDAPLGEPFRVLTEESAEKVRLCEDTLGAVRNDSDI